jgi:phycobilisome core-membrane linker protein
MTVTASSGSPRVSPQLFDTLPLSSVRQAEQQDRFPEGGELDNLITFFRSGQDRLQAAELISNNAEAIVARAANRIFAGGTPLSFLEEPLSRGEITQADGTVLAADQVAFQRSVQTFTGASATVQKGNALTRLLRGNNEDADVRVVLPTGFSPISVAKYGPERMRKSVRDMGWFLRYVSYALVAGDPSILAVNTRGLRDVLEKGCSLAATNVALQEMRAAAASLLGDRPEARRMTIDCFNVLLKELAVATPSTRQKLGSPQRQGLQLPAIYALAAQGKAPRYSLKTGMSGNERQEIVRAAYRQVFERDIAKGYSQAPCAAEASQLVQGKISMREFIRALGRCKEYRQQFHDRFVNSRVVELAYRHFLGRGISSLEEFRTSFAILSDQGLNGLVDVLVNSGEYAQTFGEETVPFLRDLGEEAQESAGWGSNRKLFRFSAPFEGAPQYVTLYASYRQPLADQHVYGGGNDPVGNQYGAIFPSATATVSTRPAPYGYDTRRLLISNGMASPGQMDSAQFRSSRPRKVGPRVMRLQQIATGGAAVPKRGGQPSIRNTESSTQAVINAVYVQVLGNAGYAGERMGASETQLENGDLSLRDFVRAVARSDAFRRRYWDGLYITKAIEVMHRRLLGRPTFGRWEIDALFDTAARKGFYGLVDALIDSKDYQDSFGEDTVPYERFITPKDVNTRRVPTWKRELNTAELMDPIPQIRPNVRPKAGFRSSGDITARNLKPAAAVKGTWTASISTNAPDPRWVALRATRPSFGTSAAAATPSAAISTGTPGARSFSRSTFQVPQSRSAQPDVPGARLAKALRATNADGFRRREGLAAAITLKPPYNEGELQAAIDTTYRQLINRIPLESERLLSAESRLRNQDIDMGGFIEAVALSPTYQDQLARMAPLRSASAACLDLLGRAGTPAEVADFLQIRATAGQPAAVQSLLKRRGAEKADQAPSIQGLNTRPGQSQKTVTKTASLYRGNAAINPDNNPAI